MGTQTRGSTAPHGSGALNPKHFGGQRLSKRARREAGTGSGAVSLAWHTALLLGWGLLTPRECQAPKNRCLPLTGTHKRGRALPAASRRPSVPCCGRAARAGILKTLPHRGCSWLLAPLRPQPWSTSEAGRELEPARGPPAPQPRSLRPPHPSLLSSLQPLGSLPRSLSTSSAAPRLSPVLLGFVVPPLELPGGPFASGSISLLHHLLHQLIPPNPQVTRAGSSPHGKHPAPSLGAPTSPPPSPVQPLAPSSPPAATWHRGEPSVPKLPSPGLALGCPRGPGRAGSSPPKARPPPQQAVITPPRAARIQPHALNQGQHLRHLPAQPGNSSGQWWRGRILPWGWILLWEGGFGGAASGPQLTTIRVSLAGSVSMARLRPTRSWLIWVPSGPTEGSPAPSRPSPAAGLPGGRPGKGGGHKEGVSVGSGWQQPCPPAGQPLLSVTSPGVP